MAYVWDNTKAGLNFIKHSVTFEYATRVFFDPHRVEVEDARRDYGEKRVAVFAEIDKRVYVVTYTRRTGDIRIISARKGNSREQKKYYALRAES